MTIIRKALNTFIDQWRKLGPPNPFGKKVYDSGAVISKGERVGFHGTGLSKIRDQILNGEFDRRNKDIYFTHVPEQAASYAKRPQGDGVILFIGSENEPMVNEFFQTTYFLGHERQKVKIYEVWELSDEWKKYYSGPENRTGIVERAVQSAKAALEEVRKHPSRSLE